MTNLTIFHDTFQYSARSINCRNTYSSSWSAKSINKKLLNWLILESLRNFIHVSQAEFLLSSIPLNPRSAGLILSSPFNSLQKLSSFQWFNCPILFLLGLYSLPAQFHLICMWVSRSSDNFKITSKLLFKLQHHIFFYLKEKLIKKV